MAQAAKEVVESPSLEIFRRSLDVFLGDGDDALEW